MTSIREVQPSSRVERLDAFAEDEIAPGQYWRLVSSLPAERSDYATHRDLDAGLLLLVERVERTLDGQLHSVTLAPHPEWGAHAAGVRMTVDRFLSVWVLAVDGAERRAREAEAVGERMRVLQQELAQGPQQAPEALQIALARPGSGGLLATAEDVERLGALAAAEAERAQGMVAWVEARTGTLAECGACLARYFTERAKALMASAEGRLAEVGRVLEMVKNLKIYTGDDVAVHLLRDGVPADASEPITIFQDQLAFDSELLLRLDADGIDHQHLEDVAQALQDDGLCAQMIPAKRGIVLVRFSARWRRYVSGDGLGAAVANSAMNEEAQRNRLLLRDGDRMWLIECDEALKDLKQLMPSTSEQSGYFERAHDALRPEHLDFARAQRRQLAALSGYARVLILLWGLRDRTEVLDNSSVPRGANWLAADVQGRHVRLVSMDSMLGADRETPEAFMRRHWEWIAPGVTVAVDADAWVEHSAAHCPGLFSASRQRIARLSTRYVVATVKSAGDALYIEVPGKRERSESSNNFRLVLRRDDRDPADTQHLPVVVLDRTCTDEIRAFVRSRAARRTYSRWAGVFKASLGALEARGAALRLAIRGAGLDPASADGEAARLWAAGTPSANVIARAGKGASRKALEWCVQMARPEAIEAAKRECETAAAREGRQLLRLAATSAGTWRVYWTLLSREVDARLSNLVRWVQLVEFRHGPGKPGATRAFVRLEARADESVVAEWPEAAGWVARAHALPRMGWDERRRRLDDALKPSGWWESWKGATGADLHALAEALAQEALRYARSQSGRMVEWPSVQVPVATGLAYSASGRPGGELSVRELGEVIVCAEAEPWRLAVPSAAAPEKLAARFADLYKHSAKQRERFLQGEGPVWRVKVRWLRGCTGQSEQWRVRGMALGASGRHVAAFGDPEAAYSAVIAAASDSGARTWHLSVEGVRLTAFARHCAEVLPELMAGPAGALDD